MASIYCRDNVYYVKFYEHGHRIRRSLNTSNRREALKFKEQIERELAAGTYNVNQTDTIVDVFWEEYLNWASLHKRKSTVELERILWTQFIEFCRPAKLGDVTPRDVERFKARRAKDGLKPRSINNSLRHLQAIYGHASKLGFYSGSNPFHGISRIKIQRNPPIFLKKEEIDEILERAASHGCDIYFVFALGIYAGLRKNEIVNARWEWFDFTRKLITLSAHDGFELKDSDSRTVPLHDRLAEILLPHRQKEGFLLVAEKTITGKNRYRYEFKRIFSSVLKDAGLEWVTPHTLRHTFASQLAMAGVSLYKISKWLGHSDVKTTQIYAHLQTHDEDINRF